MATGMGEGGTSHRDSLDRKELNQVFFYAGTCTSSLDLQAAYFPRKNRLVKPQVVTCVTFATIFVATQVARPHTVTSKCHKIIDRKESLFVTSTCAT